VSSVERSVEPSASLAGQTSAEFSRSHLRVNHTTGNAVQQTSLWQCHIMSHQVRSRARSAVECGFAPLCSAACCTTSLFLCYSAEYGIDGLFTQADERGVMAGAAVLGAVGVELVAVAGCAEASDFDLLHARIAQLALIGRPQVKVQ